jgi:hypothetical protein
VAIGSVTVNELPVGRARRAHFAAVPLDIDFTIQSPSQRPRGSGSWSARG